MINFLKVIDGNKTYIFTVITGLFTIIHFLATSDYSITAFIQLSQDASVLAVVACIRHAIQKSEDAATKNNGNLTGGVQK